MCAIGVRQLGAARVELQAAERALVDEAQLGPPSSKRSRTRRCGLVGRARARGPASWPLMPRWASSASPASSGSQRYLPRRRAASSVRPVSAAAKSAPPVDVPADRRGVQDLDRSVIRRPTTQCSSPRRTISTSGSSGTLSRARRPTVLVLVGLVGGVGGRGVAP